MPGFTTSLTCCLIAAFLGAPVALRKRRSTHTSKTESAVELHAGRVQKQDNPGARAVFSQSALDYFARDILPVLVEEEIPKVQIPDISADEAGFRIRMYNIRVTNPRVERPAFRFAPGQGLALELNDIKLDLRVNYHVDGKEWWNPINERGEASCRPTAWASAIAVLGTSGGKPTISVANPSVRISMGNININHGIIGWLIELLLPIFQGEIESLVEREITKVVQDVVDKDLGNLLAQLDLKVPLEVPAPFDDTGLHFNLTAIDARADHGVVDLMVGIIDPRTNRLVRQPVSSVIPDAFDGSRMVSVSLASEIIEDIARFHQGKWSHTLQAHEIPEESPLGLDTGSLSLLTTPALTWVWGQKDMQLTFSLDGEAEVTFEDGAVALSLPSAFKFDVKHDDAEPEHAFTLSAPVLGNATVTIRPEPEQAIMIDLQSFSLTPLSTKEQHESLWFVNTLVVNPMLEFLENSVIMPELNNLFAGGVACCGLAENKFALRRMTTRIQSGFLAVFADVELDIRAILR